MIDLRGKTDEQRAEIAQNVYPEIWSELERVKAEKDEAKLETRQIKSDVASALEEMVCTEGEDAGVFFLSPDSESNYDPKLGCHVYKHEHFSELGDALVELYKTMTYERSAE